MAYTKSQALAKNASPSTPTPSKKISKQGKRRVPLAKFELPPKKPFKSAPSSSKPPPRKNSAHHPKSKQPADASSSSDIDSLKKFATSTFPSEILEPWTTVVDADPTSSDEAEE